MKDLYEYIYILAFPEIRKISDYHNSRHFVWQELYLGKLAVQLVVVIDTKGCVIRFYRFPKGKSKHSNFSEVSEHSSTKFMEEAQTDRKVSCYIML